MPERPEPDVELKYDVPAEWKPEPPASAFRRGQYLLPRSPGDAEDGQLVVFYFGKGEGGTVDLNVARWQGMFSTKDGQAVGPESVHRTSREVRGLKVTTVDISGRFADQMMGMTTAAAKDDYRMLATIVETPDGPWFFRAVGPQATMARHRDAFARMIESIRR